jgi:hypothetical protein
MKSQLRLDDLYKMIAHIYMEQNAHRPASATFAHFVEVCGMLGMSESRALQKREPGWEGVRPNVRDSHLLKCPE